MKVWEPRRKEQVLQGNVEGKAVPCEPLENRTRQVSNTTEYTERREPRSAQQVPQGFPSFPG